MFQNSINNIKVCFIFQKTLSSEVVYHETRFLVYQEWAYLKIFHQPEKFFEKWLIIHICVC